jgi:hypothetical protein
LSGYGVRQEVNMRGVLMMALALGCSSGKGVEGADSGVDLGDSGDDSSGSGVALSSFGSGQYRAYYFQLLKQVGDGGENQGLDIDGDGEVDNALPGALPAVVMLSGNDALSLDGLNGSIEDAMAVDELIMLIDAVHGEGVLTNDVLLGSLDGGTLGIDEASYGADGTPQARLGGAFESEKRFEVSADRIEIPIIFDPEAPPVLLPLAMARIEGTMDANGTQGVLGGAIPIDDLVTQVLEPLLAPEDEYDPADYMGLERDALLDTVRDLANDTMADIELSDGSKAISAGLIYGGDSSSF